MKEQYIENFGQVVKGKTTGTVYVLVPHKHRNLNMLPTINGNSSTPNDDMPIYSKAKTVKIFAIVDGEMREYRRDDKKSYEHEFDTYTIARKIINGIEYDRSAWSAKKKVDHHFVEFQN